MKITVISDMHGALPKVNETDLLLIAGDICPATDHSLYFQSQWLDTNFRSWLKEIPAKKIIGIAGNHDLVYEKPYLVPQLPWEYLQDSYTHYEGLKVYGSPWQPYFFGWAFNLYENHLVEKWKVIPDDVDVLIVHGPPHGYGDKAPRVNALGYEHTGSESLTKRIMEIKPKLFVCGHIHCSSGIYEIPDCPTIIANTACRQFVFDWDGTKMTASF